MEKLLEEQATDDKAEDDEVTMIFGAIDPIKYCSDHGADRTVVQISQPNITLTSHP